MHYSIKKQDGSWVVSTNRWKKVLCFTTQEVAQNYVNNVLKPRDPAEYEIVEVPTMN